MRRRRSPAGAVGPQVRSPEATPRVKLLERDHRQVAAAEARVLRVGTLTAIAHSLYPHAVVRFARRHAGWRVELASYGWGEATAGLRERAWRGTPPLVVAEVATADETFEAVASGAAVTLLAEGPVGVYSRPGIVCLPVDGIGPARFAVAWHRDDRRSVVLDSAQACVAAAADVTGDA